MVIGSLFLILAAPTIAASAPPAPAAPKPITRAQFVSNIDAQFAAIDANHDGKIDKAELQAAQVRAVQQRIVTEFKRLDTNHDGQLSLQEFAGGFSTAGIGQVVDKAMTQLDTNHDGKVSPDEFRAPQLVNFEKLDANHDGVVTPAEIQAYAKAHAAPQR